MGIAANCDARPGGAPPSALRQHGPSVRFFEVISCARYSPSARRLTPTVTTPRHSPAMPWSSNPHVYATQGLRWSNRHVPSVYDELGWFHAWTSCATNLFAV